MTKNQSMILSLLFGHPSEEFYLSEIGESLGKLPGVFQKGINALEAQGIITSRKYGNQRLFKLNANYPLLNEMKSIVAVHVGAEAELRAIFARMPEVSGALIYGSYATGTLRPDSDIDVLIVGTDPGIENRLIAQFAAVEKRIRREINYNLYLSTEFEGRLSQNDPFLSDLKRHKCVFLKGKLW